MNDKPVVTRFAPSPTGFMHIGGVRTALYAYLFARKNNGTFILRIEDTDKAREVDGSIAHIMESLKWVGLDWDYGPDTTNPFGSCLQSERLELYKAYAQKLVDKGLAYPDPYTAEETEQFRKEAEEAGVPFLFRNYRPEHTQVWDGKKPLRFKVPEIKRYEWHDVVRGTLSAGEEALDDVIIIKADGFPTYNFAHIIDDLDMGVTHIMRGEEFISSTPKFLSLYDALEIPYPIFVTLPPIMGPDGKKKLSKRDGAKDLLEYRTEGYLPQTMRNFLALIGWNPGGDDEVFSDDELIQLFTLEKIHRSGGAFNEDKLRWMNRQHLNTLSTEDFTLYITEDFPKALQQLPQYTDERFTRLLPTIRERINTRAEFHEFVKAGEYAYVFDVPTYETEILKWKNDDSVLDALPRLEKVLEALKKADFGSLEAIKSAVWPLAEELGKGEVLWPLRVALSGRKQSPDPFTLAYILGTEETVSRIEIACAKIRE